MPPPNTISTTVTRALTPAAVAAAERASIQALTDIGFVDLDSYVHVPRIFAMTSADEKSGKTHLACTMPGPIVAISWDTGTKPVMHRVARDEMGKKVYVNSMVNAKGLSATDAVKEWQRVIDMVSAVITAPPTVCRSLFIDTGSAMWELCRLATLGKLTQVKSHHYGVANAAIEGLLNACYSRADLNVIISHKTGKKYVNENWDGKSKEPKMYSGMPFICDLVIDQGWRVEPDKTITYLLQVKETRDEMARVKGLILESNVNRSDECGGPVDEANIPTLGNVIYPAAPMAVWE